jgi:hypothetical protein
MVMAGVVATVRAGVKVRQLYARTKSAHGEFKKERGKEKGKEKRKMQH